MGKDELLYGTVLHSLVVCVTDNPMTVDEIVRDKRFLGYKRSHVYGSLDRLINRHGVNVKHSNGKYSIDKIDMPRFKKNKVAIIFKTLSESKRPLTAKEINKLNPELKMRSGHISEYMNRIEAKFGVIVKRKTRDCGYREIEWWI